MNRFLIAFFAIAILLTGIAGAQNQPPNPPVQCTSVATISTNTVNSSQVIAGVSGKSIYLCGFFLQGTSVDLRYGTGSTCTTPTQLMPKMSLSPTGLYDSSSFFRGMQTTSGATLCVDNAATATAQGFVFFSQF